MPISKFPLWAALLAVIFVCALGSASRLEGQERKKARGEKGEPLVKGKQVAACSSSPIVARTPLSRPAMQMTREPESPRANFFASRRRRVTYLSQLP